MKIAGITVPPALVVRWRGWFAPPQQPFLVPETLRDIPGLDGTAWLPLELQDTYCIYGEEALGRTVVLAVDRAHL